MLRKRKGSNEILTEDITVQERHMQEKGCDSSDLVESNLVKEEIMEVLAEMKVEYREVMLLHYIHELSIKEIAANLDINEGTVKTRLHRARHAMKEKVEKDPARQWIGGEKL
ncbi:RNA polymerase sigma factor [Gracilibacillus boraciitolerans]|nr:sigma-70 family RNA polymerase sigma factor [Gracilibacillus boraciitolerans]